MLPSSSFKALISSNGNMQQDTEMELKLEHIKVLLNICRIPPRLCLSYLCTARPHTAAHMENGGGIVLKCREKDRWSIFAQWGLFS